MNTQHEDLQQLIKKLDSYVAVLKKSIDSITQAEMESATLSVEFASIASEMKWFNDEVGDKLVYGIKQKIHDLQQTKEKDN